MKKLIALFITLVIDIFLSSCANNELLKVQDDTRKDMMISKNRYNNYLIKNSSKASMCEGLKQMYLVDLRAFNAVRGRSSYSDNSLEVTN